MTSLTMKENQALPLISNTKYKNKTQQYHPVYKILFVTKILIPAKLIFKSTDNKCK